MSELKAKYDSLDLFISSWMAKHSILLMRLSLGVIYFWFGVLKFFPHLSPAEDLAINTMVVLTFGMIPAKVLLYLLAAWECLIGIGLFSGRFMRLILFLLFAQMIGTFTPLFIFPDQVFTVVPIALTIEGQYIVKNLVIISGGLVIGATVRGGKLVAEARLDQT